MKVLESMYLLVGGKDARAMRMEVEHVRLVELLWLELLEEVIGDACGGFAVRIAHRIVQTFGEGEKTSGI